MYIQLIIIIILFYNNLTTLCKVNYISFKLIITNTVIIYIYMRAYNHICFSDLLIAMCSYLIRMNIEKVI